MEKILSTIYSCHGEATWFLFVRSVLWYLAFVKSICIKQFTRFHTHSFALYAYGCSSISFGFSNECKGKRMHEETKQCTSLREKRERVNLYLFGDKYARNFSFCALCAYGTFDIRKKSTQKNSV